MKKIILVVIISMSLTSLIYAQEGEGDSEGQKENNSIQKFNDDFTVRAAFSFQSLKFTITDRDNDRKLDYQPSVMWNMGIKASYKNFGIGFTTGLPMLATDEKKGESDYYDFQMNYYNRSFGVDLYYQRYNGYYLSDDSTKKYRDGDDYVQEPDLKTDYIGGNCYYLFNKDFSYKAAFEQTEKQKDWAGSFLVMVSVNYYNLSNDSSIIPQYETDNDNFSSLPGLKKVNFISIGLAAGYAYTFTLGDFYITPSIIAGLSPQKQNFSTSDGTKEGWMFINLKANIKIAAGYNGDNFFIGAFFLIDTVKTHYEEVDIDPYALNCSIFLGARF